MSGPRPIRSVLVANRGEIAVRVLREARRRGARAIAVYSDADALAMHVREADEAVRIGPAPAAESYLDIAAILAAAKATGAGAIHPGYGFLSENAAFARAVIEAGLIWIGPPPEAIDAMGDKARAKALMIEAGVPTVPGWQGEDQDPAALKTEAGKVGYPLLIKAAAGGGGRGMRVVRSASEFDAALASARREAKASFGDDSVLLERLIENARHVEIQVFGDTHGAIVHMGERDCSAQRRRQKVIEEAPSPALTPALRKAMGADAVKAARAVNYVGAGTVEFLLDASGRYYFLEMNTRLQVEHPVTEEVLGLDLAALQLDVAEGHGLPFSQDDLELEGWAVEARLYAEDPLNGFAPQSGLIEAFPVDSAPGRVDTGFEAGDSVSAHYDAMLAKFISWGETREAAIDGLIASLRAAPLLGVTTNRDFLIALLDSEAFRTGAVTTGDLDRWAETGEGPFAPEPVSGEALAAAAALLCAAPEGVLRSGSVSTFDIVLDAGGARHQLSIAQTGPDAVRAHLPGGGSHDVVVERWDGARLRYRLDGVTREAWCLQSDDAIWLDAGGRIARISEPAPFSDARADDPAAVRAQVSGAVVAVNVKPGDAVKAGDVLAVMEAMKMEMRLTAAADGVIAAVHTAPGQQAAGGALLIELEIEDKT